MGAGLSYELLREVVKRTDELFLDLRPGPPCSQRIDILRLLERRQAHPERRIDRRMDVSAEGRVLLVFVQALVEDGLQDIDLLQHLVRMLPLAMTIRMYALHSIS